MDVLVAVGFEERFGIGAVGLVSRDVGPDRVGWQENDGVTEHLQLPGPVVSGAASLQEDGGGLAECVNKSETLIRQV